jgi:hypothetical protein
MLLATIAAVAALASGVSGRAVIDPAFPVCTVGTPCSAPDRHEVIVFWRGTRQAATATTGVDGSFRVPLPPGLYTITLPRRNGARVTMTPAQLRVPRGRFVRVVLRVDVGIR